MRGWSRRLLLAGTGLSKTTLSATPPPALTLKKNFHHIVSWNVAGWGTTVKAISERHGRLSEWLDRHRIDILCLQEVKLTGDKLEELSIPGWRSTHYYDSKEPGRNGVLTMTRTMLEPNEVCSSSSATLDEFPGRCVITFHKHFALCNIYAPNDGTGGKQAPIKEKFYCALITELERLASLGHNIVLVGDFNIAYEATDVAVSRRLIRALDLIGLSESDWNSKLHGVCKDAVQREAISVLQVFTQSVEKIRASLSQARIKEVSKKFQLEVPHPDSGVFVSLGKREFAKDDCLTSFSATGMQYTSLIDGSTRQWMHPMSFSASEMIELCYKLLDYPKLPPVDERYVAHAIGIAFGGPLCSDVSHDLFERLVGGPLGLVDAYDYLHKNDERRPENRFTCWDQYRNGRYENDGARIDRMLVSKSLLQCLLPVALENPTSSNGAVEVYDEARKAILGSTSQDARICATADGGWRATGFTGNSAIKDQEVSRATIEWEFHCSNPPSTGFIYTSPVYSDHIATSLVFDSEGLNRLPTEPGYKPPSALGDGSNPTRKKSKVQPSILEFLR